MRFEYKKLFVLFSFVLFSSKIVYNILFWMFSYYPEMMLKNDALIIG